MALGPQTSTQAAILRALASYQRRGGIAERRGGPVDHLAGAPLQDFAAALVVGGDQPQPTGKLLLAGEGAQVGAAFGNDGLRRHPIHAVPLRPVDPSDAIQFPSANQIGECSGRLLALRLGPERLRLEIYLGSERLQMFFQLKVAGGDLLWIGPIEFHLLAQHEQEFEAPVPL